jgi:hypothetical protein
MKSSENPVPFHQEHGSMDRVISESSFRPLSNVDPTLTWIFERHHRTEFRFESSATIQVSSMVNKSIQSLGLDVDGGSRL